MVYSYLINLYQLLDKRINDIEFQLSQLSKDCESHQFQQGRLAALNEFRDFLTTHYHGKLPRRVQRQQK